MNQHEISASPLTELARQTKTQGPAPVRDWNPPYCGDMDLCIRRDGSWWHEGSQINRLALVKLFASILKHEDGRYFLVTPVEKVGIQVEDCPFVVVDMNVAGTGESQLIDLRTNLDEQVTLNAAHPLALECNPHTGEPNPRVLIRDELTALIHRNVFYRLAELAVPGESGQVGQYGLWSDRQFFPLTSA